MHGTAPAGRSSRTTWTTDNRELLETGRLSAVLYHGLRRDMHRACQIIMRARENGKIP